MDAELSPLERGIGETFRRARFFRREWRRLSKDWTHDHCQMCNAYICEPPVEPGEYSEGFVTFTPTGPVKSEEVSGEGYRFVPAPDGEEGNPSWICPPCFQRYRDLFDWREEGPPEPL